MSARTNWYDGQRVFADALTYSQNAIISSVKNKVTDFFSVPGIITGLTLAGNNLRGTAEVSAGAAYDGNGERVSVLNGVTNIFYNGLSLNASTGTYKVVAQYAEGNDGIVGINLDGLCVFLHIMDRYNLVVKKVGTDTVSATTDVVLGQLTVALTYGSMTYSGTPRQIVAVKTFGP